MASDPLFIRSFLDEDFHPILADLIRQQGFDCISVVETGRLGLSDEEQLEFAASEERCLFSFNVADFAVLAEEWTKAKRDHAGIVVTPQVSRRHLGALLNRILSFLNNTTADEVKNVFCYL